MNVWKPKSVLKKHKAATYKHKTVSERSYDQTNVNETFNHCLQHLRFIFQFNFRNTTERHMKLSYRIEIYPRQSIYTCAFR